MGYYYADYWQHPQPSEPFLRGVLSSRLVSHLSGATPGQLGYWHSAGHLTATAAGRRGTGRHYSWIEYSRARATVKLLRAGLSHALVRSNIDWLDLHLPRWYEVPLATRDEGPTRHSPDHDLACNSHEVGRWIASHLGEREAAPASRIDAQALALTLEALDAEGPLGLQTEYGDVVDMDPHVLGGVPVVRGTRIETGMLAALCRRELDVEGIAQRFGLDARRVGRAIDFETTIAA